MQSPLNKLTATLHCCISFVRILHSLAVTLVSCTETRNRIKLHESQTSNHSNHSNSSQYCCVFVLTTVEMRKIQSIDRFDRIDRKPKIENFSFYTIQTTNKRDEQSFSSCHWTPFLCAEHSYLHLQNHNKVSNCSELCFVLAVCVKMSKQIDLSNAIQLNGAWDTWMCIEWNDNQFRISLFCGNRSHWVVVAIVIVGWVTILSPFNLIVPWFCFGFILRCGWLLSL